MKNINKHGLNFYALDLPNTGVFNYRIKFKKGANIERIFAKDQNKDLYGISHLIEHLSFKSTKEYSTDEIKKCTKIYGETNAYTTLNEVSYYMDSNYKYYPEVISLVNNIAFNDLTKVNEEEFTLEKQIVTSEVKMYNDEVKDKFLNLSLSRLFNISDYDNVLGNANNIENFKLEDLIEVKSKTLNKNNFDIIIIYDSTKSDIDFLTDYICSTIEKFNLKDYEDKNFENKYLTYIPELENKNIEIDLEQEIKQTYIYQLAEYKNRKWPIELINYVLSYLSYFANSSLFEYVREQEGLTYYIYMHNMIFFNKSFLVLRTEIKKDCLELCKEKIKQSILDTIDSFTLKEFEDFKIHSNIEFSNRYLNLNTLIHQIDNFLEDDIIYSLYKEDIEKIGLKNTIEKFRNEFFTFENFSAILLEIKDLYLNSPISTSISKD